MITLLVEDDRDLAANIGEFLELIGHRVDYATDGLSARRLCSDNRYDAIILDVGLPGASGLDVCRWLRREARCSTPVLMLTARDLETDLLAGFDYVVGSVHSHMAMPEAEMTARVCWKPWMFSLELPHLLAGVATPTAVVWGEDDQLFPIDIGHHYVERLPDARLHLVTDAGHWVDLEQPEALAKIIKGLQ